MRQLTYTDISGRPRLRRFVSVTLYILGGCLLLAVWTFLPKQHTQETALPLIGANNLYTRERALVVPATSLSEEPVENTCPEDPQEWNFAEIFPYDNYQRIEPACVYEGIARTAAWMLLQRMGYSKPEAAHRLGFPEMPWSPSEYAAAYTNYQGPQEMHLLLDWPAHPEFFFWQLDREGRVGSVISLRGCFDLKGDVRCVVALDRLSGSAVSILGDYKVTSYAADRPGSRTFYLIEYREAGIWHLVGQLADHAVMIEEPEKIAEERQNIAARLGVEIWDAPWLASVFGITMKPLPQTWRIYGMEQTAMNGISEELERFPVPQTGGSDD